MTTGMTANQRTTQFKFAGISITRHFLSQIAVFLLLVSSFVVAQTPVQPGRSRSVKMPAATSASKVSFESDLVAAEEGDVKAQVRVGKAYHDGSNVKRNFTEAVKWFSTASQQGSLEATALLGNCYLLGHGVPQDVNQAATLIQTSASGKDPVGFRLLGILFETGQGVPRDNAKAVAAFGQAAKLKDPEAFDHLGTMFLRGTGVKKDVAKAARLFRTGARLGDSWSQLNLGEMYESGNFELPRTKTPAGLPPGSSLTSSSLLGVSGGNASVPLNKPNFAKAMRFFSMSAAQGNRVAAFKLGRMFETGRGTTQDFSKALNFYRQAAAKQYAPAQLALGKAAEFGTGTPVNLTYAFLWYSLAAEQDNAEAAEQLRSVTQKLSPAQLADAQSLLVQLEQKIRAN